MNPGLMFNPALAYMAMRGGRGFGGGYYDDTPPKKPNILWFVIACIMLIPAIISFVMINSHRSTEKIYDGKVFHKYPEPQYSKGRQYDTYYYLIVKFDSIPKMMNILVTPQTYFSVNDKGRVSFSLHHYEVEKENSWIFVILFVDMLYFLFMFGYIIWFIIDLISYLKARKI